MALAEKEWLRGTYNNNHPTNGNSDSVVVGKKEADLNTSYVNSLSLCFLINKMGVITWWSYIFLRPIVVITLKSLCLNLNCYNKNTIDS